jgi:hypothetical protein
MNPSDATELNQLREEVAALRRALDQQLRHSLRNRGRR